MVVDSVGLGTPVPIKGGPITSAADFAGRTFFWDITLASDDDADPIEAVLEVVIRQDGNTLLTVDDDHSITGQESYYEYLNGK
jgi:ATP sulfurylase